MNHANTTTAPINTITTARNNTAVLASELHRRLGIKTPLRKWMPRMLVYGFEENRDFYQKAKNVRLAHGGSNVVFDWVLTLDTAKEIAMLQRSETGKAIRNYLLQLDRRTQDGEMLNREQIAALIDLVAVLGFSSARKKCELMHYREWEQTSTWWAHRAKVLGYSVADLKTKLEAIGKKYRNPSQALVHLNPPELIRMAVIDLFIGLGKSEVFARNVGDAAKMFAERMPPVFDNDIDGGFDFKTPKQKQLIADIEKGRLMTLF